MISRYHKQSDKTKAHIQMHLSVLLWGATAVLGRGINLSEGLLVWYRLIITTLSLYIALRLSGQSIKVSRSNFTKLFFIGTLLMVHWLFFYGAIKYSNVSITLSLFASTTLFTALLEPLIIKNKRFEFTELLYSIMAIGGIVIIFYTDTNHYTIGIILALLAAFVGAFFNILNKSVMNELSSQVVSFYEIAAGLFSLTLFLPVYIYVLEPAKLWPSSLDWVLLVVLAVVCTHITLILSLNALKHLSAFTLNLAINLEPVYGIALAFLIFGENKKLHSGFFIGAGLIMVSVILHAYMEGRKTSKNN